MQRDLLIKIVLIGVLMVLLILPLSLVSGKIRERGMQREVARSSVAASWTKQQKLVGPLLVVPYVKTWRSASPSPDGSGMRTREHRETHYRYFLPRRLDIRAEINTDIRKKGIYEIPVYASKLRFKGNFSRKALLKAMQSIRKAEDTTEIGQAYLTLSVTDPRGISTVPTLAWPGHRLTFQPGSKLVSRPGGIHAPLPAFNTDGNQPESDDIQFGFDLGLRGMESLMFVATGQEAALSIRSSWPHPQFAGRFLPATRRVSAQGFAAQWNITAFASTIDTLVSACETGSCTELLDAGFGVKLIQPVDVYLQSERSVKYGLLIIGLSFISFFIFEIMKKLPIHAVQYSLVGLAIALFYLLLISLSEHIDFALSYLLATLACVGLLLFYLRYVLRGFREGALFSGILLLLYGTLYVIIQAEDFALLMGSVLIFLVLATVMFTTRNVDWYQLGEPIQGRT